MAVLYKVKDSDINIKGKHYPVGVNVLLNDSETKGLEAFLEPVDKMEETKYIIPHQADDVPDKKVSASKTRRSKEKAKTKNSKKK